MSFYEKFIVRTLSYAFVGLMAFSSCTTINVMHDRLDKLNYVDSGLQGYVLRFSIEGDRRGQPGLAEKLKKVTMVFGDTRKEEEGVIGTCQSIRGIPYIVIDRSYWEVADLYEKEELAFHELGHCILKRDHCEVKEDGASVSLMEPEMVGSVAYKRDREKLLNELFKPNSGCGQISSILDGVNNRTR